MEKYIRKIGKYIRSISGKEEKDTRNTRKREIYLGKRSISGKWKSTLGKQGSI